jgi:serine/threonine-protein kinase
MRGPVTFGAFEFDPNSRLLKRDGVELPLPPRVVGVLEVLLRRAGDVVPRQELIENVWRDAFVTDTSLAEAVSVLRQALGDDPQSPSFIQTFHRRGYRFVAPVAVQSPRSTVATAVAVAQTSPPDSTSLRPSIGMELVPWSVAIVCAVLAAIAMWQAVSQRQPPLRPVARFSIAPPGAMRFDRRAPAFALSPDGSRLAFSACSLAGECTLYVRSSDRLDSSPLAGTADAAAPFFSPDGRWIGFFSDGHLKKVSVNGGAPVTLADAADPLGGAWTTNGQIVYAGAARGLRVIPEIGGEPSTLTTPNQQAGEVRHAHPSMVPGARFLLFTVVTSPELVQGRIALLNLNARSRPPVVLVANAISAIAPAPDTLVFATGSELQVVGLDLERGRIVGVPQTALAKLAAVNGAPQFAATTDGTGIALTADAMPPPTLLWSETDNLTKGNASGSPEEAVPLNDLRSVVPSPDGRRVAGFSREDAATADLWIGDLLSGTATRMTHEEVASAAVWNRTASAVWFASSTGGPFAIYYREVDSLQSARQVFAGPHHAFPSSVSPDGSVLAITVVDPRRGADIRTIPIKGGDSQELIATAFEETNAVFSPGGQLLAYQSNDAGRWEIYIHRLSDHRRVLVSTNGGTSPFWSSSGDALYFVSGDRLMRAAVGPDGSVVGSPGRLLQRADARPVGVDFRGRVLFERESVVASPSAIITLHWDRELRQLLGPPSPSLLR